VPEDDLVHFVIEAVMTLPTGEFVVNERGAGYAGPTLQSLLLGLSMNFLREAELKEPVERVTGFRIDAQATVQLRLQIRQAPGLSFLLRGDLVTNIAGDCTSTAAYVTLQIPQRANPLQNRRMSEMQPNEQWMWRQVGKTILAELLQC
jgi:hypothetical protein